MKKRELFTLLLFFLGLNLAYAQSIFYVSATGNDSNSGTKEQPLRTVEQAVRRVKTKKKTNPDESCKIIIRGGEYNIESPIRLGKDVAGTPNASTLIAAYEGEKVIFNGGSKLSFSEFKPVKDNKILNRLDKSARNKIVCIDLKAKSVKYDDGLFQHGFSPTKRDDNSSISMLFVDKEPLDLARWPNEGHIKIRDIVDTGSKPRWEDPNLPLRGAKFTYAEDRFNRWREADDIWLYGIFAYGYADDNLKVKSIDFNKKIVTTEQPHTYGVYSSMDTSDWSLKHSYQIRGYHVYNLLEEIDIPGEYYLDRKTGMLYLYPTAGMNEKSDIRLTTYDRSFIMVEGAEYINIEGISFEHSRGLGIYVGNSHHITINNCRFECLGYKAVCMGEAYVSKDILYSNLKNNNFFNKVENCYINNIGSGGIYIYGGDKRSITPGVNLVSNCEISNYNLFNKTYCPGVQILGVGSTICHSYIHDAPHMAIAFQGNNHLIEYNKIARVCQDASDMGAVYIGRNQAEQGTEIRYNYFEDIYKDEKNKVCAVYLDDGTVGQKVYSNIFYRCGNPTETGYFGAFHVNAGFDNYFDNNVFIECKQAYGNSPWSDEVWKKNIAGTDATLKLKEQVDIDSDTYKDAYPTLYTLRDTTIVPIRMNYTNNTLLFKCDNFASGAYVNTNVFICKDGELMDPFVDSKNKNFNIRENFRLKEILPTFRPIPFDRIGLLHEVK